MTQIKPILFAITGQSESDTYSAAQFLIESLIEESHINLKVIRTLDDIKDNLTCITIPNSRIGIVALNYPIYIYTEATLDNWQTLTALDYCISIYVHHSAAQEHWASKMNSDYFILKFGTPKMFKYAIKDLLTNEITKTKKWKEAYNGR